MKRLALTIFSAMSVLAFSAPAVAQATPEASAGPVLPAGRVAFFIDIDRFTPTLTLPPPPRQDSPQTLRELRELHEIQAARTDAELARAQADDHEESIFIYDTVLGPDFSAAKLPATAELGRMIRNDAELISGRSKEWFARPRPYAVDPTLSGCPYKASKPVLTSYPSGHAMNGYAYGYVLAILLPEHGAEILSRARNYADQRLVCGLHYRSDVEASAALAAAFVHEAAASPEFSRRTDAALVELRARGFRR